MIDYLTIFIGLVSLIGLVLIIFGIFFMGRYFKRMTERAPTNLADYDAPALIPEVVSSFPELKVSGSDTARTMTGGAAGSVTRPLSPVTRTNSHTPASMQALTEQALSDVKSSPEFQELDRGLELGNKLSSTAQLIDYLTINDQNNAKDVRALVDELISRGTLDFGITLPLLLASYYETTLAMVPLQGVSNQLAFKCREFLSRSNTAVDTTPPFSIISRNDRRIVQGDVRELSNIGHIAKAVGRRTVSLDSNQAMVVDCVRPRLVQNSRIIRPGEICIYNHAVWS